MKIKLQLEQRLKVEAYSKSSIEGLSDFDKQTMLEAGIIHFAFDLNQILRTNSDIDKLINYLQVFDSAFENYKTVDQTNTVYRVCNYLEMKQNLISDTYYDLGYMSTSENFEVPQSFFEAPRLGYLPAFISIEIPQGSNILFLDEIVEFDNTTYEKEVLFKRNAHFEVLSNIEYEKEFKDNVIDDLTILDIMGKVNFEDTPRIRILKMSFSHY